METTDELSQCEVKMETKDELSQCEVNVCDSLVKVASLVFVCLDEIFIQILRLRHQTWVGMASKRALLFSLLCGVLLCFAERHRTLVQEDGLMASSARVHASSPLQAFSF